MIVNFQKVAARSVARIGELVGDGPVLLRFDSNNQTFLPNLPGWRNYFAIAVVGGMPPQLVPKPLWLADNCPTRSTGLPGYLVRSPPVLNYLIKC